tara:strand:+ start:97 stop:528 length:432 start_codon:yes stop_codon:yes gene_type:complete
MEITRDSLIDGGRTLRADGGPGVLAEMLLKQIPEGSDHVIDSIRTPAEVTALQTRTDFWLIEVRASEEIRWERLSSRGRAGDAETFEQFRTQEEAELEAVDDSGQALVATAEMADIVIQNEGSVAELEVDMGTLLIALRTGEM